MLQPETLIAVGASVLQLVAIMTPSRPWRRALPWLAAAVLALGVTAGVLMPRPTPEPVPPVSTGSLAPPGQTTNPTPASPDAPVVAVALGEWDLTASSFEVRPGRTTFEAHNVGRLPHALRIRSDGDGPRREWRSRDISPGERISLTVDLPPGVYELDCPIEGADGEHDALGMEHRFLVHEDAPPVATAGDGTTRPSGGDGAAPPASTGLADAVTIVHFAFAPDPVQVAPGTRVTWRNEDAAPHTATGEGWDTEVLTLGETGSVTFTDVGEHRYRCDLHPAMMGTILVVEP